MPNAQKLYNTLVTSSHVLTTLLMLVLLTPIIGENSLIVLSNLSSLALTEALCGKFIEMLIFGAVYLAVFEYIIPMTFTLDSVVKHKTWIKKQKTFHTIQLTLIVVVEYLSFFASNQTNSAIGSYTWDVIVFLFIASVLSSSIIRIILNISTRKTNNKNVENQKFV